MQTETLEAFFYCLNGRALSAEEQPGKAFNIKKSTIRRTEASLRQQIIELIEDSVEEELSGKKEIWLSLSAGYDATSILGACRSRGINVKCFSYGNPDPEPFSDVFLARKMAEMAGFHHEVWPMDKYPALELQKANAEWFHKKANRCGEVGAWIFFEKEIAPKIIQKPTFVFGDECFGWSDCRLRNVSDVMLSIGIQPNTSALKGIVKDDIRENLESSYQARIKNIAERASHLEALHDKKDYLYFHERLLAVIVPWRQKFAGRYGDIATPLVSRGILSFVGSLPKSLRVGKKLMRSAVKNAYPDLFKLPRARISGAPALRQISHWPDHLPPENILAVAQNLFVRREVVQEIEEAAVAQQGTNNKGLGLFGGLKKAAKATALNALYEKGRRFLPPVFNVSRELILARLQMWLLCELLAPGGKQKRF
jgi:hypothetical protein